MQRPLRPQAIDECLVAAGDPGALEACFAHLMPNEAAAPGLPATAGAPGALAALTEAYRAPRSVYGWWVEHLPPPS